MSHAKTGVKVQPMSGFQMQQVQAMGHGVGDHLPYNMYSAHTFVAEKGCEVIGFICCYPSQGRDTKYLTLLEPYVYPAYRHEGIQQDLKRAAVEWAAQKLDVHFYTDPYPDDEAYSQFDLIPINPHEFVQNPVADIIHEDHATPIAEQAQPIANPAPQPLAA